MNRRNWIVSVSTEHDDPLIFGPYVQRRAEQIAAAVNAKAERRTQDEALGDFIYATAVPIDNPGPRELAADIVR